METSQAAEAGPMQADELAADLFEALQAGAEWNPEQKGRLTPAHTWWTSAASAYDMPDGSQMVLFNNGLVKTSARGLTNVEIDNEHDARLNGRAHRCADGTGGKAKE